MQNPGMRGRSLLRNFSMKFPYGISSYMNVLVIRKSFSEESPCHKEVLLITTEVLLKNVLVISSSQKKVLVIRKFFS